MAHVGMRGRDSRNEAVDSAAEHGKGVRDLTGPRICYFQVVLAS